MSAATQIDWTKYSQAPPQIDWTKYETAPKKGSAPEAEPEGFWHSLGMQIKGLLEQSGPGTPISPEAAASIVNNAYTALRQSQHPIDPKTGLPLTITPEMRNLHIAGAVYPPLEKALEQLEGGNLKGAAGTAVGGALPLAADEIGGGIGKVVGKAKVPEAVRNYTPSGDIPSLIGRTVAGNTVGRLPGASLAEMAGTKALTRPTLREWVQALKPNPQLSLFRNMPKLGDTAGTLSELGTPQSIDQLLSNVRTGLNKKFPGTEQAWEASKAEAPKPEPNYEDLLEQSIAKAQAGKGIGPGTAHVTDPGLHESALLGAHADFLNKLPEDFTGEIMKFHNDKEAGLYQGTDPITKEEHETAANLLAQYHISPDFKNLADASRMYVHNYRVIGDIDKISLGEQPIHQAGPVGYHIKGARIEGYPIDETTLFDGTKDPRKFLTEDEGKQMVETLYGAIRNAEPRSIPLYRGIENYTYGPKSLPRLAAGDQLSLPLSSFSTNPRTAYDFGDIILKIEGPSQHLNVRPFNSFYENEHLTQGRFEVIGDEKQTVKGPYATSIDSRTGLPLTRRVITIKQVGVH